LGQSDNLSRLCHLSKNLFNEANYIIRQEFLSNGKWIRNNEIDKILKSSEKAQTSQQILRMLDKSWMSFFRSIKVWKKNPEKYKGQPKLPKYKKKNGEHILLFTNQQIKLKNEKITFPKKIGLEVKTRLKKKLIGARIKPMGR